MLHIVTSTSNDRWQHSKQVSQHGDADDTLGVLDKFKKKLNKWIELTPPNTEIDRTLES